MRLEVLAGSTEVVTLIEIEEGSGNVYADLGLADADEMLVKAKLASKIGEILEARGWSQTEAAEFLGLSLPNLSNMLRGYFRGISKAELIERLSQLAAR